MSTTGLSCSSSAQRNSLYEEAEPGYGSSMTSNMRFSPSKTSSNIGSGGAPVKKRWWPQRNYYRDRDAAVTVSHKKFSPRERQINLDDDIIITKSIKQRRQNKADIRLD